MQLPAPWSDYMLAAASSNWKNISWWLMHCSDQILWEVTIGLVEGVPVERYGTDRQWKMKVGRTWSIIHWPKNYNISWTRWLGHYDCSFSSIIAMLYHLIYVRTRSGCGCSSLSIRREDERTKNVRKNKIRERNTWNIRIRLLFDCYSSNWLIEWNHSDTCCYEQSNRHTIMEWSKKEKQKSIDIECHDVYSFRLVMKCANQNSMSNHIYANVKKAKRMKWEGKKIVRNEEPGRAREWTRKREKKGTENTNQIQIVDGRNNNNTPS